MNRFLALWIAGAVVLLEQGLYEPDRASDDVLHPTWPRGGWPALLLLCTVGLPVLLGWLTARCGKRLGFGAMLLTFGVVFAIEDPFWRLALTPVMLLSALGLLLVGQRLGWRAGRWLMRKRPREA